MNIESLIDEQDRISFENSYIITDTDQKLNKFISENNFFNEINTEDYFGKNKFVLNLSKKLEDLKQIFQKNIGNHLDDNSRYAINSKLELIENLMAKHFNVESVTFGIEQGFQIESYNAAIGKIDLSAYKDKSDNDAFIEYSKIIIDDTGMHYLHPENKILIIEIGAILFANKDISAYNLCALIIHEIGHSFYQYTYGSTILQQRAFYMIETLFNLTMTVHSLYTLKPMVQDSIHNIKRVINGIKIVGDPGSEINKAMDNPNLSDEELAGLINMYPDVTYFAFGKKPFFEGLTRTSLFFIDSIKSCISLIKRAWGTLFFNKEVESKDIKETRKKMLNNTIVVDSPIKKRLLFATIISQIYDIIVIIIKLIIYTPINFLKGLGFNFIIPFSWIHKTEEYNADNVAAAYGLSSELAESLIKLRKISGNDEYVFGGIYKITSKIPIVRVIIELPSLMYSTIQTSMCGYPSDRVRIKNLYNELVKDLNDKSIPKYMKKEIKENLKQVEKLYNNYIDPSVNKIDMKYSRSFIYYITRFIIKLDPINKKPESNIISIDAVDILNSSQDLLEEVNIKGKSKFIANKTIENTIYDEDVEFSDTDILDKNVIYESPLTNKLYNIINNNITNESYFGQVPVAKKSIENIHRIRQLLPSKSGSIENENKDEIKNILINWSNLFSQEFNVDTCTMGLESVYNAYSIPFFTGNRTEFNAANKNELVETPNGYKFKNKDNMHMYISLGIPLLADNKLSDETIAGIIFHEIGHGFQQFEIESLVKQKNDYIYISFHENLKSIFKSLITFNFINSIKDICSIIFNTFAQYGVHKTRSIFKSSIDKETNISINNTKNKDNKIIVNQSNNDNGYTVCTLLSLLLSGIAEVFKSIFSILPLPGISSLFMTICQDPFFLTDILFTSGYYKRQKNNEYYADSFAAKYGFSADMGDFFKTINSSQTNYCNIPIIKAIVQFNYLGTELLLSSIEAHPTDEDRVKGIIEYLNKELVNNKQLSEKSRIEISDNINKLKIIYNDMTNIEKNAKNGNHAKAAILWTLQTFTRIKSKSKNEEDLDKSIDVSKSKIINTMIEAYNNSDSIKSLINLSDDDINKELLELNIMDKEII